MTAVKDSEDKDGDVIRFYETEGKDSRARIKIFDKEIDADLRHNEVKTFKTDKGEVDFIEWDK